ncbi:hypothetical protein WMY93_010535 [Mugilogobius chulae]|uniref:F-box domain-containing protein n=1 Tax=Mugilogobius chulae TaxID=88201 RepID=A0AAW0PAX1_9GOBI
METSNNTKSSEVDLTETTPCAFLCKMCPSCVFAKTPPISTDPLWTVADSFQRRFLMDLLSRCKSPQVLEKILRVLDLTSWSVFTYSRSQKLTSSEPSISAKSQEKPLGFNGHDIRQWFDSSPDWIKSHYICRLLLRCDNDLLRALANLTNVLLIRQKRGLLTFEGYKTNDEVSEEPAIMVVPGSSKSYSGISRFKDFISCLPVNLAKKILGLLDESCLRICTRVSRRWQFLAKETLSDIDFRKTFNDRIMEVVKSKESKVASPTYAKMVKVRVPVSGTTSGDKEGQLKTEYVQMEERNVYCGGFFVTDVIAKRDPHRLIDYRGKTLMAAGYKDGSMHLLYVSVEAKVMSVLKGNVVQIRSLRLCEEKDLVITGSYDALISSVRCVRIHQTRVYSSCDKGHVKIWDLETAAVLKVIDSHQSSVLCLFFNEWHLLTGDAKGLVMAWSTHCEVKDCIRTFHHPREIQSLTLSYLRVVTGCADGKIRIFNFLTGDCLRVIMAGAKSNHILSVHFFENCFVVNSIAHVKYFHFGEVFWDYMDSPNKDKKQVQAEAGLVSDRPSASAPVNKVSSPSMKTHNRRKSLSSLTNSTAKCSTEEQRDSAKLASSEKATSTRIKKRGPHHPPTRDYILLKVNTSQKAQNMDEAGINMEHNARLRDDWSSPTPLKDLKTKETNTAFSKTSPLSSKIAPKREVSTAPGRIMRPHPPLVEKTQPQSAKTQRLVNKTATSKEDKPENALAKSLSDLESFLSSASNIKNVDCFNHQAEFKLLTTTQLEEQSRSQKDLKAKKEVSTNKKGL